jgi:leucine dehydrogenase
VIAIHDWGDGVSLGGCRMLPCEEPGAALADALSLSRAMTYKCASVGLRHGGGKCVIAAPATGPLRGRARRGVLLDVGDLVEELGGRFRTGEDAGTKARDFAVMSERTSFLVGRPRSAGGSGDSARLTADGVVAALEATCRHAFGSSSFEGRRFAVLGLGKVGGKVASRLAARGGRLVVADIDPAKGDLARRLGARRLSPAKLLTADADVFVPCALGGILDRPTVAGLRCAAVAGAANNQLADPAVAEFLRERGIVWAPDFIANAGGLISVAAEVDGYTRAEARHRTAEIGTAIGEVLELAEGEGITPLRAAERRAEAVLATDRSPAAPAY